MNSFPITLSFNKNVSLFENRVIAKVIKLRFRVGPKLTFWPPGILAFLLQKIFLTPTPTYFSVVSPLCFILVLTSDLSILQISVLKSAPFSHFFLFTLLLPFLLHIPISLWLKLCFSHNQSKQKVPKIKIKPGPLPIWWPFVLSAYFSA